MEEESCEQRATSLGDFLLSEGLELQNDVYNAQTFGNRLLQWGSTSLIVQVISDKGRWFARVRGACEKEKPRDESWYDINIICEMLAGENTGVLSFAKQCDFLVRHFAGVVDLFSLSNIAETRRRLDEMLENRARRMFPGLYGG